MPGRVIMRLRSKQAARVFLLLTFVIWAGTQVKVPGLAQSSAQDTPKPPATQPTTPPEGNAPRNPPASTEQPKTSEDNGVFVFRKDVDEVVLHATVVDDKQHIVTNLDKSSFTVLEDGKPQSIVSFRHEDIPVDMGIVIDNSGSMREKRAKVNQAALNLVRSSNQQDEVFVVNFNDEYYLDQDFTADLLKLKDALEKIDTKGGMAPYQPIVASADNFKNARLERKVLFVVTDGEDNASREPWEQAVKQLQEENGPSVYAIGILGDEEHPRRAKKALEIA